MENKIGVRELERRLLKVAEKLDYQVLLGPSWLGGSAGSHWDQQRRNRFHADSSSNNIWGLCDFQRRVIWLHPKINQQHRCSVLVHELGHALLHANRRLRNDTQWEAEAEEVRRIVAETVGLNLPPNGDDWELLSRRQQQKAYRNGLEAGDRIIQEIRLCE